MNEAAAPGFYKVELTNATWEIRERYQELQSIGSGAYGLVCSANDVANGNPVAIKKFNKPFQSLIHARRTYREVKLLRHMNHENIIGILDLFSPSRTLENFQEVYMVTQLMGADLNSILKCQKLSDDHIKFLIYQILRGLKYIHSAGVIHRDLKPSNIAVNEDCELRILDFGLARMADNEMTGYVATRWYRAPEIMLNWMHYNQTVDVWSVGCIMAELITGKPLFPGNDQAVQTNEDSSSFKNSCPSLQRFDNHEIGNDSPVSTTNATDGNEFALGQQHVVDTRNREDVLNTEANGWTKSLDIDQLTKIVKLVGKPTREFLDKITSDSARKYVEQMPDYPKKPFKDVFAETNEQAIDLLERMLILDSDKRIGTEEALAHPYLEIYADHDDEPVCNAVFEEPAHQSNDIEFWRRLIFNEIQDFRASHHEPMET